MKKLLFVPMSLIILTLTVFIFAEVPAMGQNKSVTDTAAIQDNVIYTCTMHPEIQSGQPGTCPKCGMALVKKLEASEKKHKKHKMKMMCPMMKDMNGMEDMEKNNSAGESKITNDSTRTDAVIYTCSMHPEIQSGQPGTCPKCGMTLIKKSAVSSGKEKKQHKMSSMGMGMGIMMAAMLVFLISR